MSIQRSFEFLPLFGLEPTMLEILVPEDLADPEQAFHSTWASGARPPRVLAHVHDPRFFDDALRRICDRVRDPVEVVFAEDGTRAVHVLGQAVLSFDASGRVEVALWSVDEGLAPKLMRVAGTQVSADPVPCGDAWLARLEHAFEVELGRRHRLRGKTVDAQQLGEYAGWAFRIFRSQVRRHCDLRRMRGRIAAALALDPQVLAIARRLRRRALSATQTRVDDYNFALAHRAAFEKLMLETPNLVRAYAWLLDEGQVCGQGEPVRQIKRWLRSAGISERGWRMLARSRSRLLDPIDEFYTGDRSAAALDYLKLLDALGLHREPPHWFVRELLQFFGNRNQRKSTYYASYLPVLPAVRHLADLVERADSARLAEIRERMFAVLCWICDGHVDGFDKRQRRAGWPWLAARAAEWMRKREVELRGENERWAVPFESLDAGSCEVRALASSVDLFEEARAMCHCADQLVHECVAGVLRVFSIRDAHSGKRLGTLGARRVMGRWEVWQVAGFANRAVPPRVASAADAAMERLQFWRAPRSRGPQAVGGEAPGVANSGAAPDLGGALREAAADAGEGEDDRDHAATLHTRVVRAVRGAGTLDEQTRDEMSEWLGRSGDDSMEKMEHGGQLLPWGREDDWRRSAECWIESAIDEGRIGRRRGLALMEGAEPNARELATLRRAFRGHVLEGGADADIYPGWYLFRIRGHGKRHAWVLATVKGYSFSQVIHEFVGAYRSKRDAMREVREMGRYSKA